MRLSRISIINRPEHGTVFGLLAVRSSIHGNLPDDVLIRVSAGPAQATLCARDCLNDLGRDAWELTCHVNSHLVDDGVQRIAISVVRPDGTELCSASRAFRFHNASDLARAVAADLRAYGTPVIFGSIVDSQMFPYAAGRAKAWFDVEGADHVPMSVDPAPSYEAAIGHLRHWGFAVLLQLLPAGLIVDFKRELDNAVAAGALQYRPGSSDRIHGAHALPAGRRIWLYQPVLDFLKLYFRDPPCACQTLTYVNGSQQHAHQDTIHLTPYPAGYMCGVWIALEDVAVDSGELFVCPRSHVLPRVRGADLGLAKVRGRTDYSSYTVFETRIRDLVSEHALPIIKYQPKAGHMLVWHENLIHGGSQKRDPEKTRLSIVSHYFARGSVAYYDSRGEAAALLSPPRGGRFGLLLRRIGRLP